MEKSWDYKGENMKKQVFDYFVNLNKSNLQKTDGAFVLSSQNSERLRPVQPNVWQYKINNNDFYVKGWKNSRNICSIFSAKMFNDIGIPTPPVYLAIQENPDQQTKLQTITQSISRIPNLEVIQASQFYGYALSKFGENTHKWAILNNEEIKNYFLSIMTPECFDDFISLFLVDEIRTERDRHAMNYFFYRQKGGKLFEGIIPIDHDWMYIMSICKGNGVLRVR